MNVCVCVCKAAASLIGCGMPKVHGTLDSKHCFDSMAN